MSWEAGWPRVPRPEGMDQLCDTRDRALPFACPQEDGHPRSPLPAALSSDEKSPRLDWKQAVEEAAGGNVSRDTSSLKSGSGRTRKSP